MRSCPTQIVRSIPLSLAPKHCPTRGVSPLEDLNNNKYKICGRNNLLGVKQQGKLIVLYADNLITIDGQLVFVTWCSGSGPGRHTRSK